MTTSTILCGDSLETLRTLPDKSARTCVTSPPYWGLRDYKTATWNGGDAACDHQASRGECKCGATRVERQIGLEATPFAFVDTIVAVFREVRRVLTDDGTLWLNLGDSYAGGAKSRPGNFPSAKSTLTTNAGAGPKPGDKYSALSELQVDTHPKRISIAPAFGLKPKDLVGVPWRVALALQADGWWLRSDIIWSKPNPMPESIQDRPTRSHEYLFLLTKSARYYYDWKAIAEPMAESSVSRLAQDVESQAGSTRANGGTRSNRPMRAVGRSDKQRGHGRRHAGFNDRWDAMEKAEQQSGIRNKRSVWTIATHAFKEAHFATYPPKLVKPCILAGSAPGDVVLDPFCGAGTTGLVASRLGRSFVGIELNPENVAMANRRIHKDAPLFHPQEES